MDSKGKVLLFAVDDEQYQNITDLCCRFGVEAVRVARADYSQKIGCLAGVIGFTREKQMYLGAEFPEPMMVLFGMADQTVDFFLEAWRKAGLAPINHKAIVTPTNVQWAADALERELDAEHSAMH